MATVESALATARTLGVDRLDAQRLLERATGRRREWLIAHPEAALDATLFRRYAEDLDRRAAGVPLAYLLGEKEFRGLAFAVTDAVLVPRPETEVLVDWAIECLGTMTAAQPDVIDLGTGSGAIAVALAHARPHARVLGTDVSEAALEMARRNAARHGVAVQWRCAAWWQAVGADERFDLVLSNPPYIAAQDAHLEALHVEPRLALVGGEDGLDALREIVAGAGTHVLAGGWLLLEHGFDQAEGVRALLQHHGWRSIQTRRDLAGLERCTGATRG